MLICRDTEDNRNFDWYRSYEELEELLSNHCHFNQSVLVVGCGNSRVSEFLAPKVKSIKNVDISECVVSRMQEQYSDEAYHENVRAMTCECCRHTQSQHWRRASLTCADRE